MEEYGNEANILKAIEEKYRTDPEEKNYLNDIENKLEKFPKNTEENGENFQLAK